MHLKVREGGREGGRECSYLWNYILITSLLCLHTYVPNACTGSFVSGNKRHLKYYVNTHLHLCNNKCNKQLFKTGVHS